MGSMKSSSNALPPHLRRLLVTGDFNVDTLEGTAQGASSLAKPAFAVVVNDAPRHSFFGHVCTIKRKNVGCVRSLESDLLRKTTSRSVPDKSWLGLRPFPYVKGSYFRLDFKSPTPSLTQADHERSRRQHTRFNSKPCMTLTNCFSTKTMY